MTDQIFTVAVSPAQRLVLVNLAHDDGQKVKGQRARAYRRFLRAFGLMPILETADDHGGKVNQTLRQSRAPALFTVTAENVDYALDLVEVERATAVDRTIGPLFDALDDLRAKRSYDPPTGALPYDPAAEDWKPEPPAKPERPVAEQIAAYLRLHGHDVAAEIVDGGDWDKPAANGIPAAQPEERPEA